MSHASKPLLYTGGGVINSGPQGEPAAARAGQAHGLSHHLDADGARRLPGVRQGVARHARHARHLRGQPRHARLRRHGVHRRALRRPHHRPHRSVLAAARRRSTSTSIPPRSTRTSRSTCRSSATSPTCSRSMIRTWKAKAATVDKTALKSWWSQIDKWRAKKCLAYKNSSDVIMPQYAIERLYDAHQGSRRLHHHRGRPAPDVGGAVLSFRGAQPLDDLGRSRHHGLWPAGGDRRAGRASRSRSSSTSPATPRYS